APHKITGFVAVNAPHPWLPHRRLLPQMWRFLYTPPLGYPRRGAPGLPPPRGAARRPRPRPPPPPPARPPVVARPPPPPAPAPAMGRVRVPRSAGIPAARRRGHPPPRGTGLAAAPRPPRPARCRRYGVHRPSPRARPGPRRAATALAGGAPRHPPPGARRLPAPPPVCPDPAAGRGKGLRAVPAQPHRRRDARRRP